MWYVSQNVLLSIQNHEYASSSFTRHYWHWWEKFRLSPFAVMEYESVSNDGANHTIYVQHKNDVQDT